MADNDKQYVKKIKQAIRKIYFRYQYCTLGVKENEQGTECIKEKLKAETPFMYCRLGAEESRTVLKWMNHQPYEERNIHNIMYNAGVFPNDKKSIDKFCQVYTQALKQTDGIFVWGCLGEHKIIKKFTPKNRQIIKDSCNYFLLLNDVWTTALEGRKVLIVHPFIDTIEKQYEKRELLFKNKKLPTFKSLCYVRTVQSNAGENENVDFDSWFEALEYMKKEIETKDFEVALIAGGAYGIPLAAHVKDMGKQAIHIASNLQILFGIRGKRWDDWSEWAVHFNEHWCYPSESETPKRKDAVEGGSYWK